MNTCIVATFDCTFEKLEARIKGDMEGEAGKFVSEYELVKVNDNKIIWLGNVADFEAMGTFMDSSENKQWDEENGVTLTAYTMKKMS